MLIKVKEQLEILRILNIEILQKINSYRRAFLLELEVNFNNISTQFENR